MPGHAAGARERRHDGKTRRQHAGRVHRRFGNADHGTTRQFPRRIQARVAETRDHVTIATFALARCDLGQQAGGGERFVVIALDRRRAHGRAHRNQLGTGCDDFPRATPHCLRHTQGCVRVDQFDTHLQLLLPLAYRMVKAR